MRRGTRRVDASVGDEVSVCRLAKARRDDDDDDVLGAAS